MKTCIAFSLLMVFGLTCSNSNAQQHVKKDLAHTFSIVARDAATGEMAVGVQSHWFAVGTVVAWGKSGVGVVATQSFVNPAYGPEGLFLMESGKNASDVLQGLVAKDEGKDFRQIAMLDVRGNVDAYTGANCIQSADHFVGENFSVQANMMLNDKVVPAMRKAFEKNSTLPLADRVLETLKAAQLAGGDIRGKQSASIIVVGPEIVKNSWEDKIVDLRVDDHSDPLIEIERLLLVHKAYEFMNRGDLAVEHNDMQAALREYAAAEALMPENLEMKYWKAIALANNDRLNEALPIFKTVFNGDENWKELTKRLPASGLLDLSESEMESILDL